MLLYNEKQLKELKDAVSNKLGSAIEKIEEEEEWTFDVIATTESVDRDWEVIKLDWWDTKYREKNPVILANHSYTIENIVGKGLSFYTSPDGKEKRVKGVFSKTNPLGKLARDLYNEGMLKTVSVGFIPKNRSEQDRRIIEEAELLELSFVAVPSNRDALSLDGKLIDEAIQKGLIKEEEPETVKDIPETKEITLKDLYHEVQELKNLMQELADGKAEAKQQEEEVREAMERKEILQEVNKATSRALENLKKL